MKSDPVQHTCDALLAGELTVFDLSARRLSKFFGKTTSMFYSRWGSLDGFLFGVGQAGFVELGDRMRSAWRKGDLRDVAEAFVRFGFEQESLYHVMFQLPHDWPALRLKGLLAEPLAGRQVWSELVDAVRESGAKTPEQDAHLLYAGLHGLVDQAITGRANFDDLASSDADVAVGLARRLAERLGQ